MISYQRLIHKPRLFKRLTGLTIEQFTILISRITPLWIEAEVSRLFRQNRKRDIGGGPKYHMETMEDKLLLVLIWYRTYPIYDLLGLLFDIDGSNIGRLINKVRPLLEVAADSTLKTYLSDVSKTQKGTGKRKKIRSFDELVKQFPEIAEVIIDVTEQKRKRPTNQKKQKNRYSGKKKQHTAKTQVTISKNGRILDISKSYWGKIHDKKILDKEQTIDKLPRQTTKRMDSGYDGVAKDHPKSHVILPHKRRRNSPALTRGQKRANTIRAKERIYVENAIARMKKYRLMAETYRSGEDKYNQDVRNIAALCNFRLLNKS